MRRPTGSSKAREERIVCGGSASPSSPRHVDVDELVVRPIAQAVPYLVARGVPGLGGDQHD